MNPIHSPDDPRHGTNAGYKAHNRHKVPVCDPCREFKRALDRERWIERRNAPKFGPDGKPGRPTILQKALSEDIDWVVVHRIVSEGQPCEANTAERLEVVRQWMDAGKPLDTLEKFVGWNVRRYVEVVTERRDVVVELAEKWAA